MPWRGPAEPGEFPTLGYDVGEWIEEHCVVPDGYAFGQPYRLTDEMWRFLIHYYRLYPYAEPWPAPDALRFFGAQLRRVQKWGKDPFGAAIGCAEAFGPTRFDGWNAAGEPVGAPYPTPLIVCLGVSEAQTDNTWLRVLAMLRNGPLANVAGLDIGDTRVILPGGAGKIEPATTSAKSRLGAPMTFVLITEPHLFTLHGGYRRVAGNVKRNVAGMDGRWLEMTNSWDPTEGSEAQVTGEANDERIYVDNIEPNRVHDLNDTEAVYAELLRQYGDSSRERGGWVNLKRILHEAQSTRHLEPDRRRYFLNEVVVGQSMLVDPVHWDLQARPDQLRPRDQIALGFDGSRNRDATALIACRLADGRLFQLGVWERPKNAGPDWKVPREQVDRKVREAFGAYRVARMYADPFRWQDYLDTWRAAWPDVVVEFPTNVEQRMDRAITRFQEAAATVTHDGAAELATHMKAAVIVKGSRKKPRPGEELELATYYLKLAKRDDNSLIDLAVAAVLAYHARGRAIEDGALIDDEIAHADPVVIIDRAWSETSDLNTIGF